MRQALRTICGQPTVSFDMAPKHLQLTSSLPSCLNSQIVIAANKTGEAGPSPTARVVVVQG